MIWHIIQFCATVGISLSYTAANYVMRCSLPEAYRAPLLLSVLLMSTFEPNQNTSNVAGFPAAACQTRHR